MFFVFRRRERHPVYEQPAAPGHWQTEVKAMASDNEHITRHTPGPWGWTYDGSSDFSIGEADDPQAKPVASVHAWRDDFNRARANCALIAAAPDMLMALKEAIHEIALISKELEAGRDTTPNVDVVLRMYDAITKAEGK